MSEKGGRPILFNTEMVKAILTGRKSQTRRAVKPQPQLAGYDGLNEDKTAALFTCGYGTGHHYFERVELPCRPDDILYVRETWFYESHMEDKTEGMPDLPSGRYSHRYVYRADSPDYPVNVGVGAAGWRPSIHMPREAARIFLRVTDVRVERLQEITYEDCKAEGIWDKYKATSEKHRENLARMAYPVVFAELWDSAIKRADRELYGWAANPLVWVISFERCAGAAKDES